MNRVKVRQGDQRGIERMELSIQFFYNMLLTIMTVIQGWSVLVMLVLWGAWVIALGMVLTSARDYDFRAITSMLLSQFAFMLWAMQVPDLFFVMPLFVSMVIVSGLYGIPEIIGITGITSTCIYFYHLGILGNFKVGDREMVLRLLLLMISTYLIEYVMFFLISKRLEGIERQMHVIRNLKEAERSKDDFLANVSHELRTPINTICGMSEIVLRSELPDEVRFDLLQIQTAGRNLLSVVSDILDFSELQSGKFTVAEENYNITSTINDVINLSMALKDKKKIELVVDCDAGIPSGLIGDEQKIRRVIMNIVDNAIKFTEEGCVTILISYRRTSYGINLIVNVKDTGIGMKEESLEKLFTNFNQVDTKRNRQEGGIGLGLAIARAMVDAMGGFLMVHSIYGKGSSAQFTIPQKISDDTPIAKVHTPEQHRVIIYVDMEQFERQEIRDAYNDNIAHMIEQLGVQSQVCQNLQELQRRMERNLYTHVFISLVEYKQAPAYFDSLAKQMTVFVFLDRQDDSQITAPYVQKVYKPLFVLPIAMLMNGEHFVQGLDENQYHKERFVAPDAHILAVDDNLMNLRVLEGLLKPYQLKVSLAQSGMEALKMIDRMDYDLVFMDHMMPEMDGVETMHRIRRKPGNYFKKVPIIALTANAIGGMREIFLSEGFQDFVGKPIELSVLERALKRHLPQNKIITVKAGTKEVEKEESVLLGLGLDAGLFDAQKGLEYCGGHANYIEILQLHGRDGAENARKIAESFEKKDWKNYAILTHALKSSMMSIGAVRLSGLAKELEQAGKSGDEEYILQHHPMMMEEYHKVLGNLTQNQILFPESGRSRDGMQEEGLPPMDDEEYGRLAEELEEAAYSFDEGQMLEIVHRMQGYSYKGHSLSEALEPVVRKIQMSDYLSASGTVAKLRDKWK